MFTQGGLRYNFLIFAPVSLAGKLELIKIESSILLHMLIHLLKVPISSNFLFSHLILRFMQ